MDSVAKASQLTGKHYVSAEFFVYTPNPVVAVIADATPSVQLSIPIQTDSDFELLYITEATDTAGAIQTASSRIVPLVTVTISQSGSGIDIFPNPVPLSSIAGNGSLPFILPESKIWPANASMLITLQRYAVSGTEYNVRLAFHGRKLFF